MPNHLTYNPSAPPKKGALFGLPFSESESEIIIYPMPWDVTSSHLVDTSRAPQAILDVSKSMGLEIPGKPPPWQRGIYMRKVDQGIWERSRQLRPKVEEYFKHLLSGQSVDDFSSLLVEVNQSTTALKDLIFRETCELLDAKKKVGLLGGSHACTLGYLEALSTVYNDFGVLQIDAHMDMKKAANGFVHSNASIMNNALKLQAVTKLVQVGIRDYDQDEVASTDKSGKVKTYFNKALKELEYTGATWAEQCQKIIQDLPRYVYISFDVDGLDPVNCPNTGIPVVGGLSFSQAVFLIDAVKSSGREIIGFDLCEIAPVDGDNEWNARVGARILYHLCSVL